MARPSDANLDRIVADLVRAHTPFSTIARRLKKSVGAIAGRVRRLKLRGDIPDVDLRSGRPAEHKKLGPRPTPRTTELASLAELKPDQCRWPIGDPKEVNFGFCGAPRVPSKPFCAEHCHQAYVRGNASGREE